MSKGTKTADEHIFHAEFDLKFDRLYVLAPHGIQPHALHPDQASQRLSFVLQIQHL